MHEYLKEIEDAISTPGPVRDLLRASEITTDDFSAGLVAALMYPQEAHLGVNGTTFYAAHPEPAGVRYATEHFAHLMREGSFLENIKQANRLLTARATCRIPRATGLVGVIAANHPDNIDERRRLYGTDPHEESSALAVKLDEAFPRLTAHIGSAYVDGEKLHRLEYQTVLTPNGTH